MQQIVGAITKRKRSNGKTGYTAQIRINRDGQTHSEAKTFDRRPATTAWIAKREAELSALGALAQAKQRVATLFAAIDCCIAHVGEGDRPNQSSGAQGP
ncbi:MAG TPA: hypothetical protein VGN97_20865 [Mesorhizobium sp.]|nr:hypothetical protein [Mesorhizobium sp.]